MVSSEESDLHLRTSRREEMDAAIQADEFKRTTEPIRLLRIKRSGQEIWLMESQGVWVASGNLTGVGRHCFFHTAQRARGPKKGLNTNTRINFKAAVLRSFVILCRPIRVPIPTSGINEVTGEY